MRGPERKGEVLVSSAPCPCTTLQRFLDALERNSAAGGYSVGEEVGNPCESEKEEGRAEVDDEGSWIRRTQARPTVTWKSLCY